MAVGRAIAGLGKDYRPLVRHLIRQGWTFIPSTSGRHPRLVSPGGTVVVLPGTPSDFRSIRNTRAAIRRIQRHEGTL